MNKVLVTGATGLIGYPIVCALLKEGRRVKALVRSPEKARPILPEDCELVSGDVTDLNSIARAMEDCVTVYHTAGIHEQWLPNPDLFYQVNTQGTRNMTLAALQKNIEKFIYISTVDIFSAPRGHSYDETMLDPEPKKTAYGGSKQQADRIVAAACEKGLAAAFIHPAAVYGPAPAGSLWFMEFIRNIKQKKIPLVPPGALPLVYSEDLAAGCLLAEKKAGDGERFILSESCISFEQMAHVVSEELSIRKFPTVMPLWLARFLAITGETISEFTGKPPLLYRGQLELLQLQTKPVSDKAKHILGWNPISFQEGVKRTIAYLKETAAATADTYEPALAGKEESKS